MSREHDWDICWTDGYLPGRRPFRAEQWRDRDFGAYHLTLFLPRTGLELLDQLPRRELARFLEQQGVVRFRTGKRYVVARKFVDRARNPIWSVNVVLGDSENWFADTRGKFYPYPLSYSDDPYQLLLPMAYAPRGRWPEPVVALTT